MGMGEGGRGTAGWYAGPLAGVQATSSAESEFSAAESSCRQACQSRALMTMATLKCNVRYIQDASWWRKRSLFRICHWTFDLVLTDAEGLMDLSMGLVGYMASSSSGQSPVVANSAVLDAALTAACAKHDDGLDDAQARPAHARLLASQARP